MENYVIRKIMIDNISKTLNRLEGHEVNKLINYLKEKNTTENDYIKHLKCMTLVEMEQVLSN